MKNSLTERLRKSWQEDGVFLFLMVVLFALRFVPAFGDGRLYAPFRDNVWLYGSLFSRVSEVALTGQTPYWIDTVLGGFPVYTTPHFSITYPFYFFGFLNYGKSIEVMYTLSYLTCFHSLILYLNLYIMLRVAGAKGLASLCGATIGLVSGNTESYATWITIAAAFSWFPLLIAGMILLFCAPLRFRSMATFSVAAALICCASPSQPVIQSAFVSAIFFASSLIWRWRKSGFRAASHLVFGLSISAVVAFALSAAAFIPMARATGNMVRAVGDHPAVYGHASLLWESFNVSQLEPRQITHVLLGSGDLSLVGGVYVGPFALLGCLLCVIAYHRGDASKRFLIVTFALIGIYFLIAGFGTHFGIAYVHFYIPLLNRMREAARNLVIFTTAAALLAGIGLQVFIDVLADRLELGPRWRRYFGICIWVSLVVFALALTIERYGRQTSWVVLAMLPIAFVVIPAASVKQRIVGTGLILLACLGSVLSPPRTLSFASSEYLRGDNLISHRVLQRVAQIPDIADYRVAILDSDFKSWTWADNASFYGIRTFYFLFTPVAIPQFNESLDENPNLRKLRGAKYFICGPKADAPEGDAKLLFIESGYRVYEVAHAMDEFTLVHSVKAFRDAALFRTDLMKGFDYEHVAAIRKESGSQWPLPLQVIERRGTIEQDPKEILPVIRTANLFTAVTESTRPGLLVLNERWNEDWRVRVDSYPAKIVVANFIQPAVALWAGRHYVEFEYKPMQFWYLVILQRVTFAVVIGVGLWKLCAGRKCRGEVTLGAPATA